MRNSATYRTQPACPNADMACVFLSSPSSGESHAACLPKPVMLCNMLPQYTV
jgi:hypothetical protein